MEIRRLNESEFESYDICIKELKRIKGCLHEVCLIKNDSGSYFVSLGEKDLAILEYKDGNLNPYTVALNETNTVENFQTEEYNCVRYQEEGQEVIRKTNFLSSFIEQLVFLPEHPETRESLLSYSETNVFNKRAVKHIYDVTGHMHALSSYLEFANLSKPHCIELLHYISFLGTFTKRYRMDLTDGFYYKTGLFQRGYDPENILSKIENYGFHREVPKDIITIFTRQNEEVKKLEMINTCYINYIKGQKN